MPDYAAKKLPTAFQMEDLKKPGGQLLSEIITSLGRPDFAIMSVQAPQYRCGVYASVLSKIFIGTEEINACLDVRFDSISVTRRRIAK